MICRESLHAWELLRSASARLWLVLLVLLELRDLLLEADLLRPTLRRQRDIEALVVEGAAVPILRTVLSVERVHLVESILDLFVLLPADVGGMLPASLATGAARKLQVEVDARAELVDIDRVLRRLVDVRRRSNKSIVARARANRSAHSCTQRLA